MEAETLIACEDLCSWLTSVDGESGSCPTASTNIEAFFCHVPAFETNSEEKQQKFIVDLIASLTVQEWWNSKLRGNLKKVLKRTE